jgi:hypothetical protein
MSPDIVGVINNGSSSYTDVLSQMRHLWDGRTSKGVDSWTAFYKEVESINKHYIEVPGSHPHRTPSPTVQSESSNRLVGCSIPVERRLGPFHCVFLNSCRNPVRTHLAKYARKVAHGGRFSYDCEGITSQDLDLLKQVLERAERDTLYLFFHCPIIHSKRSHIGKQYQLELPALLESISKGGLGDDVMLNGSGELLSLIVNYPRNVVMVTSHCLESRYYLIEKKNLIAREVTLAEFNEEFATSIFIKHLTTPCLGTEDGTVAGRGYLVITPGKVHEVSLGEPPSTVKIQSDIRKVMDETLVLRSCIERHRNAFNQLDRIIMKERALFEEIKDELQRIEALFDRKEKDVTSMLKTLDDRIQYSLREYSQSFELELEMVKKALSASHQEYHIYTATIPKIQAVFNELSSQGGDDLKSRLDHMKTLFSEWYTGSIEKISTLTQKILSDEKLFDNMEKKVIREIQHIIKDTKMSHRAKLARLKKVKGDIDLVTHEIDSYFLGIRQKTSKGKPTLYGLTHEIRSAVVFLDTVLTLFKNFTEIIDEHAV